MMQVHHGTKACYFCGTTQIDEKIIRSFHCTAIQLRSGNGCVSRRLLLAFAFDRPHKSIHPSSRCCDSTIRNSLKADLKGYSS